MINTNAYTNSARSATASRRSRYVLAFDVTCQVNTHARCLLLTLTLCVHLQHCALTQHYASIDIALHARFQVGLKYSARQRRLSLLMEIELKNRIFVSLKFQTNYHYHMTINPLSIRGKEEITKTPSLVAKVIVNVSGLQYFQFNYDDSPNGYCKKLQCCLILWAPFWQ